MLLNFKTDLCHHPWGQGTIFCQWPWDASLFPCVLLCKSFTTLSQVSLLQEHHLTLMENVRHLFIGQFTRPANRPANVDTEKMEHPARTSSYKPFGLWDQPPLSPSFSLHLGYTSSLSSFDPWTHSFLWQRVFWFSAPALLRASRHSAFSECTLGSLSMALILQGTCSRPVSWWQSRESWLTH